MRAGLLEGSRAGWSFSDALSCPLRLASVAPQHHTPAVTRLGEMTPCRLQQCDQQLERVEGLDVAAFQPVGDGYYMFVNSVIQVLNIATRKS